jgi:hypothetical protein
VQDSSQIKTTIRDIFLACVWLMKYVQKALWTSATTPIRKHVPIATSIKLRSKHGSEPPESQIRLSRKINPEELAGASGNIHTIIQEIQKGNLDDATTAVEELIQVHGNTRPR